jgi:hypothetical protein
MPDKTPPAKKLTKPTALPDAGKKTVRDFICQP